MTADEEKDPPVPSYLEGVSLKRIHDGQIANQHEDDDESSPEE
ncbi:hypothetical protein [Arthrobacter sp.]|nr:hypothetical protein [Arthrobacter sp.]